MRLFQRSQRNSSPAVITGVTLPCLKILQNVIYPKEAVSTKDKVCVCVCVAVESGCGLYDDVITHHDGLLTITAGEYIV